MLNQSEEVAYLTLRIARSTALARASTDVCARASHLGIAKVYAKRLAALIRRAGQPVPVVPIQNILEA